MPYTITIPNDSNNVERYRVTSVSCYHRYIGYGLLSIVIIGYGLQLQYVTIDYVLAMRQKER